MTEQTAIDMLLSRLDRFETLLQQHMQEHAGSDLRERVARLEEAQHRSVTYKQVMAWAVGAGGVGVGGGGATVIILRALGVG